MQTVLRTVRLLHELCRLLLINERNIPVPCRGSSQPINTQAAAKFVEIVTRPIERIADASKRPAATAFIVLQALLYLVHA
jgi:hypothetical protein